VVMVVVKLLEGREVDIKFEEDSKKVTLTEIA